jgi:putative DNA primase/helicase
MAEVDLLAQSEGPQAGERTGLGEKSYCENDTEFPEVNQGELERVSDYELLRINTQTDVANSHRFVDAFKGRILYIPSWKSWLTWDGKRWLDDNRTSVLRLGKEYAESLWGIYFKLSRTNVRRDELDKLRTFIKKTNDHNKMLDFIALAAADKRVVSSPAELNKSPILMNCQNGTLNLETGKLSPHNPADRITQLAGVAYDEHADCPEWLKTLELIFDGDRELVTYLQRLCGYMLSGLTGAHIMPIAYGDGCNGKSTVTGVLTELLGDYCHQTPAELILPRKHSSHPTEMRQLYQKRFCPITEPDEGLWIAEAKLKSLTGGDDINCRGVFENHWTFKATHKFWMSTNHKPRIKGTDEGIWRRIRLIPFTVNLESKVSKREDMNKWLVANEGPGILAWAARGFRDYQAFGFSEPEVVKLATSEYRTDEDEFGRWLSVHCIEDAGAVERADRLFKAYENSGGKLTQTEFGKRLKVKFPAKKHTGGEHRNKVCYQGLRLANEA